MTVASGLSSKGRIDCAWFADESEVKSQYFDPATLKAAEPLA